MLRCGIRGRAGVHAASFVLIVLFKCYLASEDCGGDSPIALRINVYGMKPADGGRTLDVFLLPQNDWSFEATIELVNLTGAPLSLEACGSLFSLSVAHDDVNLQIDELHIDDTEYGDMVPTNDMIHRATADGAIGFVAADPACFMTTPFVLEDSISLVRVRYSLRRPFGKEDVGLTIVSGIEFIDGLRGSGIPVSNSVTINGSSVKPCLVNLNISLSIRSGNIFLRGDATADMSVDIADVVAVALFANGLGVLGCLDAADSNDDGKIDVEDAMLIFTYLFRGGSEPNEPYPLRGEDPTTDLLHCNK